jgi:hypothetical protein
MDTFDKIRVIISLQKLFIQNQIWGFSASLREIGRELDKDLYDQLFYKSQELDWNRDKYYHVQNFSLDEYNWSISLIRNFFLSGSQDIHSNLELAIGILNSDKKLMRNIKIDKIIQTK